jgi:hypothetical protein
VGAKGDYFDAFELGAHLPAHVIDAELEAGGRIEEEQHPHLMELCCHVCLHGL